MIDAGLTTIVRRLIAVFRHRHSPPAPDWTDFNAHDPGITVLEVFAFTAEALLVVVIVRRLRSRRPAYASLVTRADIPGDFPPPRRRSMPAAGNRRRCHVSGY